MDAITAEQYAIEYQDGDDWLQYVASPDKTEIMRLWRHLQAMKVQKPIRLVGFDVLRETGAATV
jgi:hypothetical protein